MALVLAVAWTEAGAGARAAICAFAAAARVRASVIWAPCCRRMRWARYCAWILVAARARTSSAAVAHPASGAADAGSETGSGGGAGCSSVAAMKE